MESGNEIQITKEDFKDINWSLWQRIKFVFWQQRRQAVFDELIRRSEQEVSKATEAISALADAARKASAAAEEFAKAVGENAISGLLDNTEGGKGLDQA